MRPLLTITHAVLSLCLPIVGTAEGDVKVWEQEMTLPTYRLQPPDLNPMFYKHEVYQGAEKRIYPHPFLDGVTGIRERKAHRFLFLENEYIKLSVAPDMGGRLFSAVDKTNGCEIFYHQHVVKPALIGMLGAWISGGIEWCVFHHHRNTTHMPVDYTLVKNADGSATIWIGEIERRHRMKWTIGLTLYPGRSWIEAEVSCCNRTPVAHSMLYWANVAVHVNDDYQIIFPPSTTVATYHAKNEFVNWPTGQGFYRGMDYSGVDLSWWKNHPEPVSCFAWELAGDFMGGYDHGQRAGVVHVANHHIVCGAKLWEWSPGPRGRMWDKILTDSDGPYAELMVGAYSDNQPDYSWIKPGETRTFKQVWYPVRGIGAFDNANLNGAVNLELEKGEVRWGFCATEPYSGAQAALLHKERLLAERIVKIGPAAPFLDTLRIDPGIKETDLRAVLTSPAGERLIAYQPEARPPVSELPQPVRPPRPPSEVESIEELYFTGLRIEQIHNPSVDADAYYQEALRRDSLDSRSNTAAGIRLLKRGLYERAAHHFRRALVRPTQGYTRPADARARYYLGLALKALGQIPEAEKDLYRASWDLAFQSAACLELAELSCLNRDYNAALERIERSLSTNRLNRRARDNRIAILRHLGRTGQARDAARRALADDPLDFRARNELALLLRKGPHSAGAQGVLDTLRVLMRDDVQNYLELAAAYGRLAMWSEALEILRRPLEAGMEPAGGYPMLHYTLGYYSSKTGDRSAAERHCGIGAAAAPDYCFPHRLESIEVLKNAITINAKDARARYYLGNLLYEIQPEAATAAWERAAELDRSFAPVHRNLGWAAYYYSKDIQGAISHYERAIAVNPHDPRLFSELDRIYQAGNTDPEKRLAMLSGHHDTVVRSNGSFVREIMVQVLTGHYDRAIGFLDDHYFHVREGGGEIHDVFMDVHLLRGLDFLHDGEPDKALSDFVRAGEYPDNLSVGIPRRDRRAPQVAFCAGLACEAIGDAATAGVWYRRSAEAEHTAHWPETRFYQGLALVKLGEPEKAGEIFDAVLEQGRDMLSRGREMDFFAKFGERESETARQARAHYLTALGHCGLGESGRTEQALARAARLDNSENGVRIVLELRRIAGVLDPLD